VVGVGARKILKFVQICSFGLAQVTWCTNQEKVWHGSTP